jgi:TRAP-type C4-dicarboxylate transport system substrate-binding protein
MQEVDTIIGKLKQITSRGGSQVKKRILTGFILLLAAMVVVAGCGSSKNEGSNNSGSSASPSASSGGSSGGKKVEIRLAGLYPDEHPTTKSLKQFEEEVEKNSNGEIEVTVYPANQLGDYTLVYEELMKGTIEMGVITVPTQFDANLNINSINYLAESYDQAKEIFAPGSYLFEVNEKLHKNLGVKFLGFHFEGMTGIGTTKELTAPADPTVDKGILLRIPPIEMFKDTMTTMGFRTVSIPYAELYQALQTNVAHGWAGGSPVPNYTDVGDVIKYYYEYNNWFETTSILMSQKVYDSLSDSQKKVIDDAANALYLRSLELSKENDQLYLQKLADEKGVKIVKFTPEELKKIGDHVRANNWPKLNTIIDQEILDGLMASYK